MEKEELFIPKPKHKGLKIILAIILVAGLAVGGYFLYQYKFNNPKAVVDNVLKEAERNISDSIKETTNDKKYYVDGHFKIDTNINDKTLQLLKDIEAQFNGKIDPNGDLANLTVNTKYKNEKLVDFNLYYEKNIVYVLLNGIYDKYIKFDNSNNAAASVSSVKLDPKEAQTILTSMVKALRTELNKLDIKKEDTTITIDGKNVDVINNYVELKDKEVNNLIINMLTNLKGDQEFATIIGKLTGADGKTMLDGLVASANKGDFKGSYKINFYTDKGLLNKKIVSVRQSITMDGQTLSINVDRISDDEILFSLIMADVSCSLKIKETSSVATILLNIKNGNEYINVDLSMNYEKVKEVDKPNVSNSKDINSLTDQEIADIEKKLMENQTLLKLIEQINKIG